MFSQRKRFIHRQIVKLMLFSPLTWLSNSLLISLASKYPRALNSVDSMISVILSFRIVLNQTSSGVTKPILSSLVLTASGSTPFIAFLSTIFVMPFLNFCSPGSEKTYSTSL